MEAPRITCLIHGEVYALQADALRTCPKCDFAQRFLRQAATEFRDAATSALGKFFDPDLSQSISGLQREVRRMANVLVSTAPDCRNCDHAYATHAAYGYEDSNVGNCRIEGCDCTMYEPKEDYVPL